MSAGYSTELWLSRADELHTEHDLQRRIWDELRWEPLLQHEGIAVHMTRSSVTLTGSVPSYADRVAAEGAAKRVQGVREVRSVLEVVPPDASVRTDAALAEAASHALEWDVRVPHGQLRVQAAGGVLTLRGTVSIEAQRLAALECVRYLTGLRDVVDLIHLAPASKHTHLRERVETCLRRHPGLHGDRIRVETHGGSVILHGVVRSLAEREEAEEAARGVAGVSRVDDDLEIAG